MGDEISYWPLAMAFAQEVWKSSSPLKKLIMMNFEPRWDINYINYWKRLNPHEKRNTVNHFWEQLYMNIKYREGQIGELEGRNPNCMIKDLWKRRPPVWYKWYKAIPWYRLARATSGKWSPLKRISPVGKLRDGLLLEITALFILDQFALTLWRMGIEVKLFEQPDFYELLTQLISFSPQEGRTYEIISWRSEQYQEQAYRYHRFWADPRILFFRQKTLEIQEKWRTVCENTEIILSMPVLPRVVALMRDLISDMISIPPMDLKRHERLIKENRFF